MTIKTKTLAVLSAILVILAMTIGTAVWSRQSQQAKIEVYEQGSTTVADPAVPLLIGLGALSGVVTLAGSIFLFLTLAHSFRALAGDIEAVSGDDITRPFLLSPDRHDEFGPVATALRRFRDSKIEMARVRREQAEVERCAEEEKRRTMLKLAEAFAASVGIAVNQVNSVATEMPISSEAMSATAGEWSARSQPSQRPPANVRATQDGSRSTPPSLGRNGRRSTANFLLFNGNCFRLSHLGDKPLPKTPS